MIYFVNISFTEHGLGTIGDVVSICMYRKTTNLTNVIARIQIWCPYVLKTTDFIKANDVIL